MPRSYCTYWEHLLKCANVSVSWKWTSTEVLTSREARSVQVFVGRPVTCCFSTEANFYQSTTVPSYTRSTLLLFHTASLPVYKRLICKVTTNVWYFCLDISSLSFIHAPALPPPSIRVSPLIGKSLLASIEAHSVHVFVGWPVTCSFHLK